MPFAAFDLHKKMIQAVVIDSAGAVLVHDRFPTTAAAITGFAQRHLTTKDSIAVEATFNTWPVVALLTPLVGEVVVSNPQRTRAIAEARIKTDKVDALVLAQLLRLDYLPRVWQPDAGTQHLRRLTSERAALTADRTRIKNRIHAVLHHRLLDPPCPDLFSQRGLQWLAGVEMDSQGRAAIDRQLRLLAQVEQEIAALNADLARLAHQTPQVKLLMTLPGVDFAVAHTILAALGDISRFPSADQAAAYLGLVPSTRQSGQHCYHGPITKQGRGHARWMLVQAAQHVANHPGPLGHFFARIARRKNRNVAVVATARKLITIVWHMLRNHEPYRYSVPSTTQAKFARLRLQATGERRKGGFAKGSPRPAAYGSGNRTKAVPSLDAVYADHQLPPMEALKPGEEAMLKRAGLAGFAESVRKPVRVPRSGSTSSK
jgi:transposase